MSKEYDQNEIIANLDHAYNKALSNYNRLESVKSDLSHNVIDLIEKAHVKGIKVTAAFNNLITGLAIKISFPELDVRYHQTGIQEDSALGRTWFNHRGISENIIYPWLSAKSFVGAKSGWQTRTLERPKPYFLTYDERISKIKQEFLALYDLYENYDGDLSNILIYFLELQIDYRDSRNITLATPNISNIDRIVEHISKHIFFDYAGKGASRLPVLALHAILQLVSQQISRYSAWTLLELESHSAADSQTNSSGDIEFKDSEGRLIEAIEVKHNILIDENLVNDIILKVSSFQLDRYYILTTHKDCRPSDNLLELTQRIETKIGCQIVINGVIPTIRYYLRLINDPRDFYYKYTELLQVDKSITFEHQSAWNEIIL